MSKIPSDLWTSSSSPDIRVASVDRDSGGGNTGKDRASNAPVTTTSFNWPNRTSLEYSVLPTLSSNFIRSLSSLNSNLHFQMSDPEPALLEDLKLTRNLPRRFQDAAKTGQPRSTATEQSKNTENIVISDLNSSYKFESSQLFSYNNSHSSSIEDEDDEDMEISVYRESSQTRVSPEQLAATRSLKLLFSSFPPAESTVLKIKDPNIKSPTVTLEKLLKPPNPAKAKTLDALNDIKSLSGKASNKTDQHKPMDSTNDLVIDKQQTAQKWISHTPSEDGNTSHTTKKNRLLSYSMSESSTSANIKTKIKEDTNSSFSKNNFRPAAKPLPITATSEIPPDDGTKPQCTYAGLIAMAILRSPEKRLTLSDIYQWIKENYSWYRNNKYNWANSIRHNLTINKAFVKQSKPLATHSKGNYWSIDPRYQSTLTYVGAISLKKSGSHLLQTPTLEPPKNNGDSMSTPIMKKYPSKEIDDPSNKRNPNKEAKLKEKDRKVVILRLNKGKSRSYDVDSPKRPKSSNTFSQNRPPLNSNYSPTLVFDSPTGYRSGVLGWKNQYRESPTRSGKRRKLYDTSMTLTPSISEDKSNDVLLNHTNIPTLKVPNMITPKVKTKQSINLESSSLTPAKWTGFPSWASSPISRESDSNGTYNDYTAVNKNSVGGFMLSPLTPSRTLLPPADLDGIEFNTSSSSTFCYGDKSELSINETFSYLSPRSALNNHRAKMGQLFVGDHNDQEKDAYYHLYNIHGPSLSPQKTELPKSRGTKVNHQHQRRLTAQEDALVSRVCYGSPRMMIDNERNCSPKMGPRSNDRSPPSISSAMEVENYLDGVHDIFGVDICQVVGRALVDEEYYDNDVVEDNVPSTPRLMSELVTRSSVTYRGGILSPFTSQFLFSRLNHDLLRFDSPIKTQDLPQHRNNEGN